MAQMKEVQYLLKGYTVHSLVWLNIDSSLQIIPDEKNYESVIKIYYLKTIKMYLILVKRTIFYSH